MKKSKKLILSVLSILLLTFSTTYSQNTEITDTTNHKLIVAAKEIMNSVSSCALITLDKEGRPRVRAMDPFKPESDLTVWFGTNAKSRKVDQIKNDDRVTLYYLESDASSYVMIHGTAELIDDKKEKEKRWKDEWEAFYTNKKDNYLLIKVTPIWMEVSSTTRGIYGNTITWQPPHVIFDSKQKFD